MDNLQTANGPRQPRRESRPWVDLFGFDPFRNFVTGSQQWSGMDIERTDSGYTVEIPVAGFKPEEIEMTFENGVLTISGKSEKRSFTRSLAVPEEIDAESIQAKVEHGMLTLKLNLSPKAQPKKIQIQSE